MAESKTKLNPVTVSTPSAGSVRVGDKYHRVDKRMTVEIVRVTETHVECEAVQDGGSWRWTDTIEKFRELEARSLEWGAVFEPAPNDESCGASDASAATTC